MDQEIMDAINAAQANYLKLDAEYPAVKKFLEEFSEAKTALVIAIGIGHHFQGPDGRVHEVVEQEWKSVRMEPFAVNSTKRAGDDRGSLSAKRAVELGYTLPE